MGNEYTGERSVLVVCHIVSHTPKHPETFLAVHNARPFLAFSKPLMASSERRSRPEVRQFFLNLLLILVSNSFLLPVVRPGAPSSVLAPSSDARSP